MGSRCKNGWHTVTARGAPGVIEGVIPSDVRALNLLSQFPPLLSSHGRALVLQSALQRRDQALRVPGRAQQVGRLDEAPKLVGVDQGCIPGAVTADDDPLACGDPKRSWK
jgi:hypothetical protein